MTRILFFQKYCLITVLLLSFQVFLSNKAIGQETPGDVADGLSLWLDHSSIQKDFEGYVLGWNDKTETSDYVRVEGSLSRPVSANRKSCVKFTSTSGFIEGDNDIRFNDAFVVLKPDLKEQPALGDEYGVALSAAFFKKRGANYRNLFNCAYGSVEVMDNDGNQKKVSIPDFGTGAENTGGLSILNATLGGDTHDSRIAFNGVDEYLGTNPRLTSFTSPAQIGVGSYGAKPFNGLIAEVIVYNRVLTATERAQVNTHLALTYSIAQRGDYVAPNANMVWDASANVKYKHELLAFGFHSGNYNVGSVFNWKYGIGEDYPAAKRGNREPRMFVFGHNNLPQELNVSNNDYTRMSRTWKTEHEGTFEHGFTVGIIHPTNELTHLLVSATEDFSGEVSAYPLKVGGAKKKRDATYFEASVPNFHDGGYFTFAKMAPKTIYVKKTGEGENTYTSLKEAVANAFSGDEIILEAGVFTESEIEIFNDIKITGQGPANTIIEAAETFGKSNPYLLRIDANAKNVAFESLTLQNAGGADVEASGAITSLGDCDVSIVNCCIRNNYGIRAGAISFESYNNNNLTIKQSTIFRNSGGDVFSIKTGGPVYVGSDGCNVYIENTSFIENNGMYNAMINFDVKNSGAIEASFINVTSFKNYAEINRWKKRGSDAAAAAIYITGIGNFNLTLLNSIFSNNSIDSGNYGIASTVQANITRNYTVLSGGRIPLDGAGNANQKYEILKNVTEHEESGHVFAPIWMKEDGVDKGTSDGAPKIDQLGFPRDETPDLGAVELITPKWTGSEWYPLAPQPGDPVEIAGKLTVNPDCGIYPFAPDNVVTVKGAGSEIIVPNGETLQSKKLIVENGGKVTVKNGGHLRTPECEVKNGGELNIDAGGTGDVQNLHVAEGAALTLKASKNGLPTGSIIIDGEITGTGNMYLERFVNGTHIRDYISRPVVEAFHTNNLGVSSVWKYTNTGSYVETSEDMAIGYGYDMRPEGDDIITFGNTFNNEQSYVLAKPVRKRKRILSGNPYPSAIDWDAQGWTKTGLKPVLYRWSGDRLGTWNGEEGTNGVTDGVISVAAGFQLMGAASDISVVVTKAARVHEGKATPLKSKEATSGLIRLSVSGNTYSDETVIILGESANTTKNADKLFESNQTLPHLFTLAEEVPTAINYIKHSGSEMIVPVHFKAGESGLFEINLKEADFALGAIYLEDTQTGKFTDISTEAYEFKAQVGKNENRFALHFSKRSTTDISNLEKQEVKIYGHEMSIYTHSMENNSLVTVYDLSGYCIYKAKLQKTGLSKIDVAKVPGVYLVRVTGANSSKTSKVILK